MESRTHNTKRNILASYLLMILQVFFSFISKSAIVFTLGKQYLGLSGLFTSILTVLNVAELGFTTSIVYFMYKPIADGDVPRVCALLAYLKKVYRYVGIAILVFGIIAGFLLPYLIHDEVPNDINIYYLYVLYLINTVISYFFAAHKTALLTAVQRLDLTKIAGCLVTIIQYALQLIALFAFKNYYLFVVAMIVGTGFTNLFAAYISKKKFPEYVCKGEINDEDKREILHKVKGLLICNVSVVTYYTLDNIVISAFVGLAAVAIYGNYITIYKAVNQLIVMIRSAMQASVGNSVAKEPIAKNLHDVFIWQFLFSVISTWCASCMLSLYQPFMVIWMGPKMLLPFSDVILIVAWFSVDIVQQAHFLYLTAAGLWNDLRYSYIFNTCCNLILNIFLGKTLGVTGILIASLVTCVISGTFWQCIIIFREYFEVSAKKYILTQFKYFLFAVIIIGLSYYVTSIIGIDGVGGIVIKALVCGLLSASLIIVLYCKNPYLKDAVKLARNATHKK